MENMSLSALEAIMHEELYSQELNLKIHPGYKLVMSYDEISPNIVVFGYLYKKVPHWFFWSKFVLIEFFDHRERYTFCSVKAKNNCARAERIITKALNDALDCDLLRDSMFAVYG